MDSTDFARASAVMPGGVSSPVRAYRSVGGTPVFLERAAGARVFDDAGRGYLDLVGSWGPALLGHAHPEVVAEVTAAAARGLSFGAPTWAEVALAEAIRARVPACEKVRFVSTGTEATMTAVRLARAATGRDLVVKFAGCYHGHSDGLLAAAGSGVATAGLPGSAGVTAATAAQTIVVGYNDPDGLAAAFAAHPGRIAAVITEAAPANMGVVPPAPAFNRQVRELCTANGALLVFDEVLTGFRVGPAGWWGLEGRCAGWVPDLFTFGKVVGGGMPLAALGGAAGLLDLLAPVGPVYQAGTLSGNPLATAAGLATLRLAGDEVYARVDAASSRLGEAVTAALALAGVPHRLQRAGSLFSVFFGEAPAEAPVLDYNAALAQDTALFTAFFHRALSDGVMLPPSAFEAWFVSASHDDAVLDEIEAVLPRAAEAAARALGSRPAAAAPVAASRPAEAATGSVVLVGGGPGDPGLMTLAGLAALRAAEVVLYDHLAPLALLAEVPPGSELVDVGKLPRGRSTPQEEIQACMAAGVPVRVVPGVSSSIAGPELAGIPVTHRGLSQGFTVVSAHVGPGSPASILNWEALAATGTTLVVLMGVQTLPDVCAALLGHGLAADTPAAVIENAGHPHVRVVRETLAGLPAAVAGAGIGSPAVTIIGAVAGLELDLAGAVTAG